jgi:Tol biopolymer transport system component
MNFAMLSPDGRRVAFASQVGSGEQIFVMPITGGDPMQLTHDAGRKYLSSFSRDGRDIYYYRTDGELGTWAVPANGGPAKRLFSGEKAIPADGDAIYYLKEGSPSVYRTSRVTLVEEEAYRFEKPGGALRWLLPFPGGDDVLVAVNSAAGARLFRVSPSRRAAHEIGVIAGAARDPVWREAGRSLLVTATIKSLTNIWQYSLPDRAFTQATFGPGPDGSPMPAPDGRGLYFVSGKRSGVLTRYQVNTQGSSDIVVDTVTQPMISPDASRVMYVRRVDFDRAEVRVTDLAGARSVKLIGGSPFVASGDWSPDSSRVVFMVNAGGASRTYIAGADGSGLREIPGMSAPISWAFWAADGKSVFMSTYGVGYERTSTVLWRADAEGRAPAERVMTADCMVVAASKDGRYLLGSVQAGDQRGIYQLSLADQRRTLLVPGVTTLGIRFAPDFRSFIYPVAGSGEIVFYRQRWRDGAAIGKPQVALRLPGFALENNGNAYDFTPDLSTIVHTRDAFQADLFLLTD